MPESTIYRYRFGVLHWCNWFSWLVVLYNVRRSIQQPSKDWVIFAALIIGLIWLEIRCWVERIEIGPEGIKWVDWKGSILVQAPIDQIGGIVRKGTARSCRFEILTTNGIIHGNPSIRNFYRLVSEIDNLVQKTKV